VSPPLENTDAERRLNRILWCNRIRTILLGFGAALTGIGGLLVLVPFGLSVSNPVVIPQADPNSGIAIIQSLPSRTVRYIGLLLGSVGVILLLCSVVIGELNSADDS
jgi:hypothetical protein